MPIVNIMITREGSAPGRDVATAEEKARLIEGVSTLLRDVLGKPLDLDELRSLLGDPQGPTPSEHHAMA